MFMAKAQYLWVFGWSWLVLLAARLWDSFWAAVSLSLAFLALALLDVPAMFGPTGHAVILFAFGATFIVLFLRGRTFYFPSRADTERRIEKRSALLHRPLEMLRDRPAEGLSEAAKELWQREALAAKGAWRRAKIVRFQTDVPLRDRFSLRHAALLLFAIGLVVAQADTPHRLRQAFSPAVKIGFGMTAARDVWIAPPEYTQRTPVFLAASQMSVPETKDAISVPEGSVLKIRLGGFRFSPRVTFAGEKRDMTAPSEKNHTLEFPLRESGLLKLSYFMIPLGRWQVDVVPDTAPEVKLLLATGNERGALKLSYEATDDYGVASITGVITSPDSGDIVHFNIPPSSAAGDGKMPTHIEDLSWHPLAGSPVEISLVAKDAAGHVSVTPPQTVFLPERKFTNPAAERIIRERKRLILYKDRLSQKLAIRTLADIAGKPVYYKGDMVTFLALAMTVKRLAYDGDRESVDSVIPLLWDVAVKIEDGGLSTAARELSEALQKLSNALKDKDIPKEEIDRMVADVQKKMREYVITLAREMQQRMEMAKDMKTLSPDIAQKIMGKLNIEEMMKRMRDLGEGTGREQMQKMADFLRQGVDDFDLDKMQKMREQQQKSIETLNDLQELIQQQQGLLDKTNKAEQGSGGAEAAKEQAALRKKLGDIARRIAEMTPAVPEGLAKADQSMKEAEKALSSGDMRGGAVHQKEALAALQEGMDQMAQQMAEAMQDMMSMNFMAGEGFGEGFDPLGREEGGRSMGGDVEIPDEKERRRVQEIIRELRQRSNDYQRPQVERDYIERLLDTFN